MSYPIFQYSKFLSVSRLWNHGLLFVSFWVSRVIRRPIVWGEPFAISIEPTSVCNLKCPQCPTGTNSLSRPRGSMSLEVYSQILKNIGTNTWYLNLYLQGEPTIHPRFVDMIKQAKEKNMYVITSTNGHFLTKQLSNDLVLSGLDAIIISYDGATQDVYEKYRVGGEIKKVQEGITHLKQAKVVHNSKTPVIEVQFIIFQHNEDEIMAAKRSALALGADRFVLKSAQFYDKEEVIQDQTTVEKFIRYSRVKSECLNLVHKQYNHCWISWSSAVVTWQGDVLPCCFDKDGAYSVGSAIASQVKAVFVNKESVKFKRKILIHRKSVSICDNCIGGISFFS